MNVMTVSDMVADIREIINRYGVTSIPKSIIEEKLGVEIFADLIGLRYIRKAGYVSPSGSFSTRRRSTRDMIVYDVTEAGIDALILEVKISQCPNFSRNGYTCKGERTTMKQCRRCLRQYPQPTSVLMGLTQFKGICSSVVPLFLIPLFSVNLGFVLRILDILT